MRLTRVLVCFWLLSQWICGQAERERHFQEAEVVLERARGSQGVPRMSPSNERQPIATPRNEDTIWIHLGSQIILLQPPFYEIIEGKDCRAQLKLPGVGAGRFSKHGPKMPQNHPRGAGSVLTQEVQVEVEDGSQMLDPTNFWHLHVEVGYISYAGSPHPMISHGFTPTTWD